MTNTMDILFLGRIAPDRTTVQRAAPSASSVH